MHEVPIRFLWTFYKVYGSPFGGYLAGIWNPHTKAKIGRSQPFCIDVYVYKHNGDKEHTGSTATKPQHCNPMPADYSPSIAPMPRSGAEPGWGPEPDSSNITDAWALRTSTKDCGCMYCCFFITFANFSAKVRQNFYICKFLPYFLQKIVILLTYL